MWKIFSISLLFISHLLLSQAQTVQEQDVAREERIRQKLKERQERIDAAYAAQLKRIWKQTQLLAMPEKPEMTPKPQVVPVTEGKTPKITVSPLVAPMVEPLPASETSLLQPTGLKPEQMAIIQALPEKVAQNFFGHELELRFESHLNFRLPQPITEFDIGEAWDQLSDSGIDLLLWQMIDERKRMQLDDWGWCQLVYRWSRALFPEDLNSARIFQWYCMVSAGYRTRGCITRDSLFLLIPTQQKIYGGWQVPLDKMPYYLLDLSGRLPDIPDIKVVQSEHPGALQVLDLDPSTFNSLPLKVQERNLKFVYAEQEYSFLVRFNRNLVEYYRSYPFIDVDWHFQAPLSAEALQSLKAGLNPILKGKSEAAQINVLLRFVQTAFVYETDESQFGEENYLFAEESLFYPAIDCEDRSILFSHLVRELLQKEVVAVRYPGHLATAVHLPEQEDQLDFVLFKGKRYYICDPTYMYADFGMGMPDLKDQVLALIEIVGKK